MTFTIYELIDPEERLIHIGMTENSVEEAVDDLKRLRHPAVFGVSEERLPRVRIVETFPDRGEAQRFYERYRAQFQPAG